MTKLAAVITALVAVASIGTAQEIGMVTLKPNLETGELRVDMAVRPDGEKVYIVRKGQLVAGATVRSSGAQGGAVLALAKEDADKVLVGDRVSLSPTLSAELPETVYNPSASPSLGDGMVADAAVEVSMPVKAEAKGELAAPRLTPRGAGVPMFPVPAVTPYPEQGVLGPYGQGLAAAAPVGTPYLRSPAFAGPPIIYMPQTVTRVLVPASTPYPHQLIPTRNYIYASAPFLRTDIYVNLPFGTYYWPQGYAGVVPVEPQVPAYVMAPSAAMPTSEASYAAGRYITKPTTLDEVPVSVSATSGDLQVIAPEAAPVEKVEDALAPFQAVAAPELAPATPAPATPAPAPEAPAPPPALPALPGLPGAPEAPAAPPALPALPGLPGAPDASAAPPPALPALPGLPGAPGVPPVAPPALPGLPGAPAAPEAPAAAPQALPGLPGAPGAPPAALPGLPPAPEAPAAAPAPAAPAASPAPAAPAQVI